MSPTRNSRQSIDSDGRCRSNETLSRGAVRRLLGPVERCFAIVPYIVSAAPVCYGVMRAGIHATIAGVITGLMLTTTDRARDSGASPARRLEPRLHPWVACAIMPLFALASAGVDLRAVNKSSAPDVAFGIVAGLLLGKLTGVVGFSLVAVRLGIAALPREVTFRCLVVLGLVAGIGFTMALFVARLAFQEQPHLYGVAQLAILSASGLAALATLLVGRNVLPSSGTRMPAPAPVGGGPGTLEREPR